MPTHPYRASGRPGGDLLPSDPSESGGLYWKTSVLPVPVPRVHDKFVVA